jgi:hypothetical protein
MRTLLLATAALFVVTTFGCNDGDTSQLGMSSRRTPRKNTPVATSDDDIESAGEGDENQHDPSASEGETAGDTGNPAADETPDAPASSGTASSDFGLTLASATPSVGLGEEVDLDVTIEPKGGFTGPVDLAVTGLPAGATSTPVKATVAAGATSVKLPIKVDFSAPVTASNTSVPLVVTGTSGGARATANANFKIAPKVKITIPVNVDALRAAGGTKLRSEYGAAFGPQTQPLKTQAANGIVVTIFNADSKPHIIHGPGGSFPHGNTGAPIQPNAFEMDGKAVRTRTLTPGANVTAYPHDGTNGMGASFRIQVATAN